MHDVQPAEVEAVVGVQVGQEDRVERERVDMALEHPERAVPHIEEDAPYPLLVRRVGDRDEV